MKIRKLYSIIICCLFFVLVGCSKSTFTDLQGNSVELSSSKGQWLAVNFWAEWCEPCREEVPELNKLADAGKIRVLGLDFDGSQGDELVKKAEALSIRFPVLRQSPLAELKAKTPQVLPATFIVNPDGELVETLYGPQTRQTIEAKVKELQEKQKNG